MATQVPGPGSYDNPDLESSDHKARCAAAVIKTSSFGSSERRFVNHSKQLLTPGPGQYQNNPEAIEEATKEDSKLKKSSSMFVSKSKRNVVKKQRVPPVGAYDISNNTIAKTVEQKAEYGLNNPLLQNI
jgi:hypothetical protein